MYRHFFKRVFDILISGIGLILAAPVFLILAILVRIKLGSPILFTQYRPGKNGKIFKFYKFRSMSNKTDKNGYLLPDDQRLTKFGKILRKTSLDELPQFWCIFIGKMSFIGPRPRMAEECVFLNDTQQDRFKVRPGITGLAQINGRNNITFDKVVDYDKQYVEHITFWGDVKIFFMTIFKVFKREGVNKEGSVSNEFYGDYLLRTKQIDKKYYDKKIKEAFELVSNAKGEKTGLVQTIVLDENKEKQEQQTENEEEQKNEDKELKINDAQTHNKEE